MSIITKVLQQTAVYWAPGSLDRYGQPANFGSPVELNARWEDVTEETVTPSGTKVLSKAKVMVSADVQLGGVLWLGSLSDCPDIVDPKNIPGAYEIVNFQKVPNFRCTEYMRIAYL